MAAPTAMKFVPRRSAARGNAEYGWLRSYHTFSFANYHDSKFDSYGPLRVINEDVVAPGEGFGEHQHREFEIWSYIVSGELEHKDSLGNLEIMKRGEIQMTSTGTGITHSEYNRNPTTPVHFLQIWGLPKTRGLKPSYYNRKFSDEEKMNKLVQVVGPVNAPGVSSKRNAGGPAPVHANISMFASILNPASSLTHSISPTTKKAYLHLIMRSGYRAPSVSASEKYEDGGAKLRVNGGLIMEEGDGAFVDLSAVTERELKVENLGEKRDAEWLLFEME